MKNKIDLGIKYIKNLLNVGVARLNTAEDIRAFAAKSALYPTQRSFDSDELLRRLGDLDDKMIYELTDDFAVHCIYLHIDESYLAIGPFCVEEFPLRHCEVLLSKKGIPPAEAQVYKIYRSNFPTISQTAVQAAAWTLLSSCLDDGNVIQSSQHNLDKTTQEVFDKNIEPAYAEGRNRYIAIVDSRYAIEQKLMDAITEGDSSSAVFYLHDITRCTSQLGYIDNSIVNVKVGAAISRTIMRIAASRSPVSSIELDTVATKYAQKVDKARSLEEITKLTDQTAVEFCTLVQRARTLCYSPIVRKAIEYISINLTQAISVQTLAAELEITPNYLSNIFKKETGTTLSHYVHLQRVKKATKLLIHTSMSIQEISTCVGFLDCNYFTKVFKQIYSIVPSQFRRDFGYLSSYKG
jgi:AraC-like DNA-binding protein